jgi:arabinose-5-phosphate isomerase
LLAEWESPHIGAKIAATLASTGTLTFFVNPVDAFHGDIRMITKDDIVLAISNSDKTDELLRFIPYLEKRNIPLIGMSGNPKSLLAQYSTYHITFTVDTQWYNVVACGSDESSFDGISSGITYYWYLCCYQ